MYVEIYVYMQFHSFLTLGLSSQAKTGTFLEDTEKPSCLNIYITELQNICLARKPFFRVDKIKQANETMKTLRLLYKFFKESFLDQ